MVIKLRGIITLCGSTKFRKDFERMNGYLTLNNFIVLSVGTYHHSTDDEYIKKETLVHKGQLDSLHKKKISLSRCILVVGDGYIGESTKSEIEYANSLGKPVYYQCDGTYLNLLRDYQDDEKFLVFKEES